MRGACRGRGGASTCPGAPRSAGRSAPRCYAAGELWRQRSPWRGSGRPCCPPSWRGTAGGCTSVSPARDGSCSGPVRACRPAQGSAPAPPRGPSDSPVGLRPSLLLPQGPKGCGFQCWKGWGASQTQGLVFWNLLRGHRPTRLGLHGHVPGCVHTRQNRVGGHAGAHVSAARGQRSEAAAHARTAVPNPQTGLRRTSRSQEGSRARTSAPNGHTQDADPRREAPGLGRQPDPAWPQAPALLWSQGTTSPAGRLASEPSSTGLPCSGVRERPPQQAGPFAQLPSLLLATGLSPDRPG